MSTYLPAFKTPSLSYLNRAKARGAALDASLEDSARSSVSALPETPEPSSRTSLDSCDSPSATPPAPPSTPTTRGGSAGTKAIVTINVHLKSGHNLKACDKNGKSDPFVVLTLGGKKQQSSVIKKTLNPTWDEYFTFSGDEADLLGPADTSKQLRLKVRDKDVSIGINALQDEMGVAYLSLAPLRAADSLGDCVCELNTQGSLAVNVSKTVKYAARQSSSTISKVTKGTAKILNESSRIAKATASTTLRVASHPQGYAAKAITAVKTGSAIYALDKALDAVGEIVRENLKDPDMPESVKKLIDRTHASIWTQLTINVKETATAALNGTDKQFRESLTKFRSKPPAFWPRGASRPQPFRWFRVKLLYTLMPSDGTFWTTLKDPWCTAIRVLLVVPVLSTLLFVVLFVMIRKRDEFQLIQYVNLCRGMQALAVGAVGLIVAGVKFYGCLADIDENMWLQRQNKTVNMASVCAGTAPGFDLIAQLSLIVEPLRLLTVWSCHYLLLSGYARGGRAHLLHLEKIRHDAADGQVDGAVDESAAMSRAMDAEDDDDRNDPEPVDEDVLFEAAERELHHLLPRYGLHMRYFAYWDVGCFFMLAVVWGFQFSHDHHAWMMWVDIFYFFTVYSLLMLPFIALGVPVVNMAITDAHPTGYDQAGMIGAMLSREEVKAKREFEKGLRKRTRNSWFGRASAAPKASSAVERKDEEARERVLGALTRMDSAKDARSGSQLDLV